MKKNDTTKKPLPIKPKAKGVQKPDKKKAKKIINMIAPAEGKIVNKIVKDTKYRKSLFSGFMKGLTFGLYNP